MTNWRDAAADLVLGAVCPGCGEPGLGVCAPCRAGLLGQDPVAVHRQLGGFPQTSAAGVYDGPMQRLLTAHKERGARHAGSLLGGLLARSVAIQVQPGPVCLVPVPSSASAVRRRGYDSVELLAREAVRRLRASGVEAVVRRCLRQTRALEDQAGLDTAARWSNLSGAMVSRRVSGQVVIVDDICTTGATLTEACRALLEAGARPCRAATVGATILRRVP